MNNQNPLHIIAGAAIIMAICIYIFTSRTDSVVVPEPAKQEETASPQALTEPESIGYTEEELEEQRRKAAVEAERQRRAEIERQKRVEAQRQQQAADEAERRRIAEIKRKKELEEETLRRNIKGLNYSDALTEKLLSQEIKGVSVITNNLFLNQKNSFQNNHEDSLSVTIGATTILRVPEFKSIEITSNNILLFELPLSYSNFIYRFRLSPVVEPRSTWRTTGLAFLFWRTSDRKGGTTVVYTISRVGSTIVVQDNYQANATRKEIDLKFSKEEDEYITVEMLAQAPQITIFIDGKKVAERDLNPPENLPPTPRIIMGLSGDNSGYKIQNFSVASLD